jgi:hypothetical protein
MSKVMCRFDGVLGIGAAEARNAYRDHTGLSHGVYQPMAYHGSR